MAKKKKSSKNNIKNNDKKKERIVTMQALQEQSSDSDDDVPPESEWNADAKALKARIEEGQFDQLVRKLENEKKNKKGQEEEEESSIEEVDLDDDDESGENDVESSGDEEMDDPQAENEGENESDMEEVESDVENDDIALHKEEEEQDDAQVGEDESIPDDDSEEEDSEDDKEDDDDGASDDDDEDQVASGDHENKSHGNVDKENRSRALHIVTEMLVATKKNWPWAETFDVIPETPLPFGTGENDINIHDDLKRELAFYDMALEAVMIAKAKCREANIPFTRPEDFFAEMVKTDDHMAKVKDRLIFENKKMEAVAQRKASKEQKLRAKESQAHKQAEKSRKKKEHFRAVEEWAESAANNRGRRLPDKDDGAAFFQKRGETKSKKRQYYDQKYGFGGKRGRFKQNDPKTLNDPSGFNRNGNFGGTGTKRTNKTRSGSNRPGKRARDSSRKRSR